MANYAIDPDILKSYLPEHTELDLRNGTCYVSLVGFMFLDTRIKGLKIPFHTDFEEVNLRFYVRFKDAGEWKRGTVFIKEVVPKPAIAFVANTIYGEKYEARKMRHSIVDQGDTQSLEYAWKLSSWNSIKLTAGKVLLDMGIGSEEEFILEHYWGLSKGKRGRTTLYGVEHPRWQVYETLESSFEVDFEENYGSAFAFLQQEQPASVFLAEGSEVLIRDGGILKGGI
jgi:uncharacterized protein YqjF (DUF2071 family)